MDEQLIELMGAREGGGKGETEVRYLEPPGRIEIRPFNGEKSEYTLKTLRELYVPGTDAPSVDPQDEKYINLFQRIEGEIAEYYLAENPELTDGSVGLTLDQLALDPDSPPAGDRLAQRISLSLRLTLSLWDYSRQEVRAALRKIRKSVERHSKIDGRRGYLDFIVEFFEGGGGY